MFILFTAHVKTAPDDLVPRLVPTFSFFGTNHELRVIFATFGPFYSLKSVLVIFVNQ